MGSITITKETMKTFQKAHAKHNSHDQSSYCVIGSYSIPNYFLTAANNELECIKKNVKHMCIQELTKYRERRMRKFRHIVNAKWI